MVVGLLSAPLIFAYVYRWSWVRYSPPATPEFYPLLFRKTMRFSFTTSLLSFALLISAVGCYKNIPAELMEPVCRIVRETRKSSEYVPGPRTSRERITVGSDTFDVYFTDSLNYSYDLQGRLLREQSRRPNGYSDTKYTYTGPKLNSELTEYTKNGVISQVYAYSMALDERGYDTRYRYDAEGIQFPYSSVKSEKRIDGNIIQQLIDDDGLKVTVNYTYDLKHLSLPNPRQFEGKRSRNLLLTQSSSGFHCCRAGRNSQSYQFDYQGRAIRQISVYWYGEFSDGSPPVTVYVTDYEYECM